MPRGTIAAHQEQYLNITSQPKKCLMQMEGDTVSLSYQGKADESIITGATSAAYTVTADEEKRHHLDTGLLITILIHGSDLSP